MVLDQSDEFQHCLPRVPSSHGPYLVPICQGLISSVQYSLRPLVSFCSSFSMPCFPVRGCQTTNWLIIILTFINASTAFRAFSNSSFASTNLTIPCVGALSDDIACSPAVAALSLGEYYPQDTLSRTCTADCGQALALYENKVIAACGKQTWKGYEDTDMPLAIIPDMLRYHYNVTCLMDSGRYCNAVAAKAAAALDSEGIEKLPEVLTSEMVQELTTDFNLQIVSLFFADRWALVIPLFLQILPIPVICASSRIFNSRPAPHTSTDQSFKSDRSISLKHQVAASQATRWPPALSLSISM